MKNQNFKIPWAVIVITLFVFWPVGLGLMVYKLNNDKKYSIGDGKNLLLLGVFIVVIGGAAAWDTLGNFSLQKAAALLFYLFFSAGGVCLVVFSQRQKADSLRYKKYITLISRQNESTISDIASCVGVSSEQVKVDLKKLIGLGFFIGGHVDDQTDRLVFKAKAPPADQHQVVSCHHCGAENRIHPSQPADCEYCDTPLS